MPPVEFIDYYEILGLTPTASLEDVREAWRRCARLYHPDLNPRKTSFRFRRAKEAYDTLSDPPRRKDYDRLYRIKKGVAGRGSSRRNPFMGTPPGARTPPPPRPSTSRTAGSTRAPRSTGGSPAGSPSRSQERPPAPGRGSANPTPGAGDMRTRTTFRPATVFKETHGSGLVDSLKDALRQGGASRVSIKHNGRVIWEAHITSALLDDLTRLVVTPLTALLRLLGQEERFEIVLTDELVEEYNRANKLFDEGKHEEAKAAYKKCVERDKYFADAHLSLGAVYEAQHDIPVAIKCYSNAVKIDPTGEAGRFARENLRRLRGY